MSYTEEQMALRKHIDTINEASRKRMEREAGLFIGIVTNDLDHWADYGIYNVEQYEFYMDYEGCKDWLASWTNKGYARYALQDCKTVADIEAVFKRHEYLENPTWETA